MSSAESTTENCPAEIQFGEELFSCELRDGHSGPHTESGVHQTDDEELTYTIQWRFSGEAGYEKEA